MNHISPDNPTSTWRQRITLATVAGTAAGLARAITTWVLTQLSRHP